MLAAETYRGNTKSRVFHQSSCQHYTCKNCTATFSSAEAAIEAGYHGCGVCRPSAGTQRLARSDEAYSGNTNSRKFHSSSCRYATCKNCTAKFKTRQAAIDAGYIPGECCDP